MITPGARGAAQEFIFAIESSSAFCTPGIPVTLICELGGDPNVLNNPQINAQAKVLYLLALVVRSA